MLAPDATTAARPVCPRPARSSPARSARSLAPPALAAVALLLVACQRAPLGASARPGASSAASAGPGVEPAAPASAAPAPSGPLWRDAHADPDDALLLARLAEGEGAAGLLDALDGPRRDLALTALPLAADAELAAGPLGVRLRGASPAELPALVAAVDAIARRPRGQTEPLTPGGWRGCHEALAAVARRTELPASLRAAAVTAARRLEERFPPPRAALPTDFDR